jgi:hypothetical protein
LGDVFRLPTPWPSGLWNSAPGVPAPRALRKIVSSGRPTLQLDDGIGDVAVLEAHGIGYALFFGDVSNPHFGIGRYLRPIDPSSRIWWDEGAADGSSWKRSNDPPHVGRTRYRDWMSSVEIEQKSYEMPPREGISIAHFLTVADIERSARYYEKVFGARILSHG